MKKLIIVLIVIGILAVAGIIFAVIPKKEKPKSEYETEIDMVVKTKQFLRTQVNYPDTLDFVDYPEVEWKKEENQDFAIISGKFKSANAFGVYSTHKFAVAMKKENFLIISYKIV